MRAISLAVILAPALAFGAVAQEATAPMPQAEQMVVPPSSNVAEVNISDVLTKAQADAWLGKPVYSSDGKEIGEVVAFVRDNDDAVSEMHADIGGFLGLGETRVKLTPAQIELRGDRVIIVMTSAQARELPKVE